METTDTVAGGGGGGGGGGGTRESSFDFFALFRVTELVLAQLENLFPE